MNEKLSVSAIGHGTVIDHIPKGQAIRIIKFLSLLEKRNPIMVGVNLNSSHLGKKDLIKIENFELSEDEVNKIMAFAPSATINKIKDYVVDKKISGCLPDMIYSVFICPDKECISNIESISTAFYLSDTGEKIILRCHYCERIFDRDSLEVIA